MRRNPMTLPSKALLVLALASLCLHSHASTAGVHPDDATKFSGGTFECGASGVSIPASKVNDEYCDCPEGGDEPGTSACPDAKFYCKNRGSQEKWLHSATVNDGVCDCCDASDEAATGVCSNTCRAEGARMRQWRKEELQRVQAGLRMKQEYIQKAQADMAQATVRVQQLQVEVADLKAAHSTIEAAKKAAEEKEEETKKVMREKEEAEKGEAEKKAEEERKTEEEKKKAEEAKEVAEKAEEQERTNRNERHAAPMDDATNRNERHAAPMAAAGCTGKVVVYDSQDFTGWEAHFEKGEYHFSKFLKQGAKNDQVSAVKVPAGCKCVIYEHGDYGGWSAVLPPGDHIAASIVALGAKDNDVSSLKVLDENEEVENDPPPPPPKTEKAANPASETYKDPEADKLRTQFSESQNKLTNAERDLRENESKATSGFEPAFGALRGQCFELRWQQYKYEICPFDKVKQDHTSLGTWGEWTSDGAMKFSGGQSCWSGPARSARVEFECGQKNEVYYADEPERCAYLVKMRSPAACKEDYAAQLEAEIAADQQGHDEV